MSNKPSGLPRNQIAEFATSARSVRALEQLLKQVGQLLPEDILTLKLLIEESYLQATSGSAMAQLAMDVALSSAQNADIVAGSANSKADAALEILTSISLSLELIALQPTNQKDVVQEAVGLTPSVSYEVNDRTGLEPPQIESSTSVETHDATSKVTPANADEIPITDSTTSFSLKKLTWANLKAALATWINGGTIPASFTTVTTSGEIKTVSTGTSVAANVSITTGLGTTAAPAYQNLNFRGYLANRTAVVRSFDQSFDSALSGGVEILVNTNMGADVLTSVATLLSTGATFAVPVVTPGGASFLKTSAALTNGAAAAAGTLLNAPTAGNPTKWIGINDNGIIRYIPSW